MIIRANSLRHRLVAIYTLLVVVLCVVFGGASYLSLRAIEKDFINKRLETEFDRIIDYRRQNIPVILPDGVRFYVGKAIPAEVRNMHLGLHEVHIGDKVYKVLIREKGGQRFALYEDQSAFERIENILEAAIPLMFAVGAILAIAFGRTIFRRVISPITQLADIISSDEESAELPFRHLPDEIGLLSRAFSARTEALRNVLLRERLFTADVSHELRTPLTVILGASELLLLKYADTPELREIGQRIRRTALETSERLSALFLLSRSPESMERESTSLLSVLKREVERFRPSLNGKPVDLHLEAATDILVVTRRELVATAVGNLIHNACQYTQSGEIVVRLHPGRITVEDTGSGIPESVRPQIFDRYVRGEHKQIEGSGLGLAIVKRIADHLGWWIELQDRPGGGTRFTLSFSDYQTADVEP